ncbi:amino acid adenylation domain-containing protein [Kutzneria sp. NPDC051319]|uniref:amino acid adenylation domain-containing protein n=1 Tax=Kutzneria sp. NPDC051319 TaxID=3155047 RepID=UPI00341810F5
MDELHGGDTAGAAHRALNGAATAFVEQRSIPDVFRSHVAATGEGIAVECGERTLTYRELDELSDSIAVRLSDAGTRPGHIVGLCARRSPEMIAGLLAILKCGAAYLPVDTTWPDERVFSLLRQAGCSVVATDRVGSIHSRLPHLSPVALESAEAGRRPTPVPAGDAAYVNFTSGSQGRPKGVLIGHRAVLRLVSGATYARLDRTRRLLQLAPVTFDAATFEIWGALLAGGTCVLYPDEFLRLSELKRVIVEHGVTTAFFTTALFNSIVDEAPDALDSVDEILTGGEHHSLRHMRVALARYGAGRVVHVYGPTESTTFATSHRVSTLPVDDAQVPIGRPIQHTRAYIVAGERLCAPAETGELLLAGDGLAHGYLGMPEKTAERFIVRTVEGCTERLYRTGDLVHIDNDGRLVFEGRVDDQVKINGFRIEPGELAHHLGRDPQVRHSFVCVHDGSTGRQLLAFVVPADPSCTAGSVRERLAAALPSYLLPAGIHLCDELPRSPNGKVDRQVLLALHARQGASL